jgi:uncharacterized LabA/DUF88 family protein
MSEQTNTAPKNSIVEYTKNLEETIESRRDYWNTTLQEVYPMLTSDDPVEMTEMQSLALSYRQMLTEEIASFLKQSRGIEAQIKRLKRDKFIYYSTGQLPAGTKRPVGFIDSPLVGLRTTKGEMDMILSGDFSEYEMVATLYSDMVLFLRESVKTVDHSMYGIKNRIELLNLLLK